MSAPNRRREFRDVQYTRLNLNCIFCMAHPLTLLAPLKFRSALGFIILLQPFKWNRSWQKSVVLACFYFLPHQKEPGLALLLYKNRKSQSFYVFAPIKDQPSAKIYPSICRPRNPAAVVTSLTSISPIFAFGSLLKRDTLPIASPSQIIGATA